MGLTTPKQQGPVLIVLPRALIPQWHRDLSTKIQPPPRICIYRKYTINYSESRFSRLMKKDDGKLAGVPTTTNHTVEELQKYDVVLTTYNTIRIQHDRMMSTQQEFLRWLRKKLPYDYPQRTQFPLFVIPWWFVILDEAHKIANPATSLSMAAQALPGLYRIPMTGSPLQNDYTDVQGLLAFMRVLPWSNLDLFKQVSHLQVNFMIIETDTSTSSILCRREPRRPEGMFLIQN